MDVSIIVLENDRLTDWKDLESVFSKIDSETYPVIFLPAFGDTEQKLLETGVLAAEGFPQKAQNLFSEIKSCHLDIIRQFLEQNPGHKNSLISESCSNKLNQITSRVSTFLKYAERQQALTPGLSDAVTAAGEQLSSYIFAQLGLSKGLMTHYIDARKLIKTDTGYGNANPKPALIRQKTGSVETVLEDGFIPVMGKSYGEGPDKTTTRLSPENSAQVISIIRRALKEISF